MNVASATEITMPRLSDSMEEGTILSWLVAPGDQVAVGDDLIEIETDKANMTVEAEAAGTLEILAEEGSTLPIGAPIARLLPEGGAPLAKGGGEPAAPPPASDAPPPSPAEASLEPRQADEVTHRSAGQPAATPLARRIAAAHGVELGSVAGTGVGGRITRADVSAAAGIAAPAIAPPAGPSPTATAPPPASAPAAIDGAKGASETQQLSRLQQVIARRMAESKSTVPHFQVETEVRMDSAIELRAGLKRIAGDGPVPSFNDIIVRATALALRRHPKANGSYRDGAFELHRSVNVGIAVAADDALVVPTIFDADQKTLGEIGSETRRLAERVRAGSVTPPELAGGTFTVSNLGMFGMTAIYPVINPPQAAILGVGKTRQLLMRGTDGGIEDASLMTLTLSCDHRILYGAEAAQFLAEIRDLLEAPLGVAL